MLFAIGLSIYNVLSATLLSGSKSNTDKSQKLIFNLQRISHTHTHSKQTNERNK